MTIDIRQFLKSGKLILPLFLLAAWAICAPPRAEAAQHAPLDMEELAARLTDTDRATRIGAAIELGMYGQDVLPSLIATYDRGSAIQRRGAVIGLALLPSPQLGAHTLFRALRDQDMATRSLAAHGLALIGPQTAPDLALLLSDEDATARNAAALALRLMGEKGVPALTRALKSEDEFTRSKAAWLLGRLGKDAESAIPALINALDAEDERVMHVVAEAIDLIGPDPRLVVHHLLLLHNAQAGFSFYRIGNRAAPTLVRLLARPGTPLAQLAFRTLSDIGAGAVPALSQAIASGTPGQQVAAALLLVEIDPSAVHTLPEEVRLSLSGVSRQPNQ